MTELAGLVRDFVENLFHSISYVIKRGYNMEKM
jgi:hypothetical protein